MNAFERKLEEIKRILEELRQISSEGALIIVEGEKDVKSLRKLGIEGEILPVKAFGRSFIDVLGEIEQWRMMEVVLLMDFDRRGREWTMRLAKHLEAMKAKPNLTLWRRLLSLTGRDVKDIEGLSRYINTLREKIGKDILSS